MPRLRVGFAGTPSFAASSLRAILAAGFDVPLVLTQPDRPSGRGMSVQPSPVKMVAGEHKLTVAQPPSLKAEKDRADLLVVALDVLVVAAYGLILPPAVLAWPLHGGINVHASLLPRWRGAAPIQHAILAGDRETGISIMQMDAGLDTGPVIDMSMVPIDARETAGTLSAKLASEGARAIVRVLQELEAGARLATHPQPADGATYAPKVMRGDAQVDWHEPASAIDRRIRAFDPVPGAFTAFGDLPVKIWCAEPAAGAGAAPGTVVAITDEALVVACGAESALAVHMLQPAGGKRMSAPAFAAGRKVTVGARFSAEG